jgi:hypothetical protein
MKYFKCAGMISWCGCMAALVILLPFSVAAQEILPANLQCESKSNPIGLSEISPRLSWQVGW